MSENIYVSHGHETHSLKQAKECPVCREIAEEFERDLARGEVQRLLEQTEGEENN